MPEEPWRAMHIPNFSITRLTNVGEKENRYKNCSDDRSSLRVPYLQLLCNLPGGLITHNYNPVVLAANSRALSVHNTA